MNGFGEPAYGNTLLSTVRATYYVEDEEERQGRGVADIDLGEPKREKAGLVIEEPHRAAHARTPARRGGGKRTETNGGPLGFEDTLWKAADKLRGSMDASEYKHVVLGLIFLKYIDDSFTERREQLTAELAKEGFDEDAQGELLESRDDTSKGVFWVSPEARWSYLLANAKQPEIGKLIDNAIDQVEVDNPTLRGVLPKTFSRPALDQRRLGELVDLIAGIGVGSTEDREKDVLGRVYEYFIGRFASAEGKGGGEFYTPRSVVKLLVEMIEPYRGRVYDPCFGLGGMLVQSESFVEAHGGRRNDISIFGEELNDTTWRLGKMNLAMASRPTLGHAGVTASTTTCIPTSRPITSSPIRRSTSPIGAAICFGRTPAGPMAPRPWGTPTTPGSSTWPTTSLREGWRGSCWQTDPCPPSNLARGKSARRWSKAISSSA